MPITPKVSFEECAPVYVFLSKRCFFNEENKHRCYTEKYFLKQEKNFLQMDSN
jgi:hypothetical protein